jgi:flagellar basal body-associated protein FliL
VSKKRDRRGRQARTKQRKDTSLLIPILVGAVVLAIIVGAIISIEGTQPATAGQPGGDLGPGNTSQPLDTRSVPYPDVPRVSPQETQQRLEQGQAVLVDVRDRARYDASHAAGAISIPEEEVTARLNELPRDKEVIFYCT